MARHGDLAQQLMAWRNKPEGPIEPVKTNWSVIPANDNNPEEVAELGVERSWRMTPSVGEIMANVFTHDVERNDAGQIVRIGKLRFSDGSQTERAYCYGPEGKIVQYDERMPTGAMLETRDKPEATLGGSGHTERSVVASNSYFAEMFDVDYPVHVKAGKPNKRRALMTKEEQLDVLATHPWPEITVCPPALPSGGERVAENFVGMHKGKKGESGAIAWEDIAMSKVHREVWDATMRYLSEQDIETLDNAMEARTLADIAPGGTNRGARKRGVRRLVEANDNLREARNLAA
jgi:hypothetical protein